MPVDLMKTQLPTKRIAKTIAESGICSRRQAEKLITLGKVFVNDIKIITPAFFVNANDKIIVEGKLIKKTTKTNLFILHKPKGVIVSSNDPQGRKTIYDIIPNNMKQLHYIGRLDFNTEGLLSLTKTFPNVINFSACLLEQIPDSAIVLAILFVGSWVFIKSTGIYKGF